MKESAKRNFSQFLVPLITFSLFFASCSKETLIDAPESTIKLEMPKGKKVGDLIIDESTIILNPASLKDAKEISDKLLIFKPTEEQSAEITVGSILVGARYNEESVENVMGRVQHISVEGDVWRIELLPVKLEEFILEGSISGRVELTDLDVETKGMKSRKPVIIMQDVLGFPSYNMSQDVNSKTVIAFPRLEFDQTFKFPIPETTVGDVGGGFSLKAGFTPVIDYNIEFKQLKGISDFKIVLYAKDIILDSHLKAHAALRFDQSVADAFPIPIAPIVLGPTGLVISPTLGIGPFLKLELGTAVDIKLFHVEGDISYELTDLSKKPVFDLVSDPYSWNETIDWTIGMKAETGLECRFAVGLSFVTLNIASVGASAKLAVGVDAVIRPTNSASFDIYGLGQAEANIKIGAPPLQIVQRYPIVSWKPVIYNQTFTW